MEESVRGRRRSVCPGRLRRKTGIAEVQKKVADGVTGFRRREELQEGRWPRPRVGRSKELRAPVRMRCDREDPVLLGWVDRHEMPYGRTRDHRRRCPRSGRDGSRFAIVHDRSRRTQAGRDLHREGLDDFREDRERLDGEMNGRLQIGRERGVDKALRMFTWARASRPSRSDSG